MPKLKTVYICQNCAYESPNWVGMCPNCKSWNSFIEEIRSDEVKNIGLSSSKSFSRGKKSGGGGSSLAPLISLAEVSSKPVKRLSSNIGEFDRVLGGGFVPGQVVLLGGDPGIGKSTLLTQIAKSLSEKKILYVCGEENVDQIKVRTSRMNYKADNLLVLQETDVSVISSAIESNKDIQLAIIDSIQTLYHTDLTGISGTVTQVRGCAQILTNTAKTLGIPIIMVSHVTKEGVVAGPKILEHIVDTVLYLEGDSQHMYRILRTNKNRFGPVSEVGMFEMAESGMKEITNPSELSLSERAESSSGSCITVIMEGFRPILFEVQALTLKTSFGYPKRTTSGFNVNRLQVLLAIMEKRCGLNLSSYDVYLNVAGGFKINEYAADLAVCLAVASSIKDKPVKSRVAAFGECGLNGELRSVSHQEKRIKEGKKLGFTSIICPETTHSVLEALNKAI